MPGTRRPYRREFRQQMVELVRADRDEGRRRDGLTSAERKEIRRLRRENRQLKVAREILAKDAAWFARETDPISKKSSDS